MVGLEGQQNEKGLKWSVYHFRQGFDDFRQGFDDSDPEHDSQIWRCRFMIPSTT